MNFSVEIRELLSGFESRMRFVNIVKSITGKKHKAFDNDDIFDNLIVMVLVYIMDHTLRYDEKCTLVNIADFISEVTQINDSNEIASYIVVDILQNGGKRREFTVYDSITDEYKDVSLRIIIEDNGFYRLTDEAYDFLFRTKEIDIELDFSVERFKLNEFIKRGNYTKALTQSRELVNRIRVMVSRMDDFILHCRENISKITAEEYDNIVCSTKILLQEEYKELDDIRKTALKKQVIIRAAAENGIDNEKAKRSRREIDEIIINVELTINEQKKLINKKYSMSDIYRQCLDESFASHNFKRFDFAKEILLPAQNMGNDMNDKLAKLFIPFNIPKFDGIFSIGNFYARQQKLREQTSESGIDMGSTEDVLGKKIEERNNRFIQIINSLFHYMNSRDAFKINDWITGISPEDMTLLCGENSLLNVILQLYSIGEIDIDAWNKSKESNDMIMVPLGEFELSYCLENIDPALIDMQSVIVAKIEDETFTFDNFEMSNFIIEVKRS